MRWLHLSDIHYSSTTDGTSSAMLKAKLPDYIKSQEIKVDHIFVTGDYRHAGKYDTANAQIVLDEIVAFILGIAQSAGIKTRKHEKIHIVPGNHDLERDNKRKINAIIRKYKSHIGTFKEPDCHFLINRFAFFKQVNQCLYPNGKSIWPDSLLPLHTYRCYPDFNILYLNTVIASNTDKERGYLVIGNNVIYQALQSIKKENPNKPIIVLAHHSMDCFSPQERKQIETIFRDHPIKLYLCGDAHEGWNRTINQIDEVTMGCLQYDKETQSLFSVGELLPSGEFSITAHWWDGNAWGKYTQFQVSSNQKKFVSGSVIPTSHDLSSYLSIPKLRPVTDNLASLLNADCEIVAFDKTICSDILTNLDFFTSMDDPERIQLIAGQGGIGKTRLMIEYCQRLCDKGWIAGFLNADWINKEKDLFSIFRNTLKPVFIVVDYAESFPKLKYLLEQLLSEHKTMLCENALGFKPRLRIVLLAREIAGWFDVLCTSKYIRYLFSDLPSTSCISEIPKIPDILPTDRPQLFKDAVQQLSIYLKQQPFANDLEMPDFSDSRFGRILYIHMAALARIEGISIDANTLLADVVWHEKSHWLKMINDMSILGIELADVEKIMTAITLMGGISNENQFRNLVSNLGLEHNASGILKILKFFYSGTKNGHAAFISPLLPDILGEQLVLEYLTTNGEYAAEYFLKCVFQNCENDYLKQGFTIIGRIGEKIDNREDAKKWLQSLLDEKSLEERYLHAIDVAQSFSRKTATCPITDVLTNSLEKWGTIKQANVIWETNATRNTLSFRQLYLWCAKTRLAIYSKKQLSQDEMLNKSQCLREYGMGLTDAENFNEAYRILYQALCISRKLLRNDDSDKYRICYIRCLIDIGRYYHHIKCAEKAIYFTRRAKNEIIKLNKKSDEDYRSLLARTMSNLGIYISENSVNKIALRYTFYAKELFKKLFDESPEDYVLPYAQSLNNFSATLIDFLDQGVEYIKINKALATTKKTVKLLETLLFDKYDEIAIHLAIAYVNYGKMLVKNNNAVKTEHIICMASKLIEGLSVYNEWNNYGEIQRHLYELKEKIVDMREV